MLLPFSLPYARDAYIKANFLGYNGMEVPPVFLVVVVHHLCVF